MCIFATAQELTDTQIGPWTNFFAGPILAQWAVSEIFIFFYVSNFDVVFFIHILFAFILN
jgi:hypothetical protein